MWCLIKGTTIFNYGALTGLESLCYGELIVHLESSPLSSSNMHYPFFINFFWGGGGVRGGSSTISIRKWNGYLGLKIWIFGLKI